MYEIDPRTAVRLVTCSCVEEYIQDDACIALLTSLTSGVRSHSVALDRRPVTKLWIIEKQERKKL